MLAAAALLAFAAAGTGAGDGAFTARSDRHSDGVPLAALTADDPLAQLRLRGGRHLAYIDDELRASRRDGAWTWSVLARQSASLAVGRDTLELALQAGGRAPASADRHWDTSVRYRQFSGGGLELERGFEPAGGVTATIAVQALVLSHWRARRLDGPAAFEAATGIYRFDLHSQEADDRMHEPFQQPFAARGFGLLVHGSLETRAGDWQLGLAVHDFGWLHWHGLPRQDLVLSTQTRDVDADGFVVYKPLVQGRNRQDGPTQALGGRWTLRAAWAPDEVHRVEAAVESATGFGVLPAITWQRRVGEVQGLLRWRLHERRLTVGADWRSFTLRLGADRLGAGAHSREWTFGYAGTW